ncbi:hypothetical protein C8Q74DRAFT_1242683 [Fomes fomentarius]|nr:hypothetical protein C8Q74DRAFT_1242683 [Fomes fomentarius]
MKPTDPTALTTSTPDPSVSPPIQATLEVTEDLTANSIPPPSPTPHSSLPELTARTPLNSPSPNATRKTKRHSKSARVMQVSNPSVEIPEEDFLKWAVPDVFIPVKTCPGEENMSVPGSALTPPTSSRPRVHINTTVRVREFHSTLPSISVRRPSSSSQTSSPVPTPGPSPGSSPRTTSSHDLRSPVKTPRPILKTRSGGHGKGDGPPPAPPPAHIQACDAERGRRTRAALKRQASALGASRNVRRALAPRRGVESVFLKSLIR